jgi:hypothetical protein
MDFLEGVAHVRLARLKERVLPPLAFHVRVLRRRAPRSSLCARAARLRRQATQRRSSRRVSAERHVDVCRRGVKVLDFGIAKAARGGAGTGAPDSDNP